MFWAQVESSWFVSNLGQPGIVVEHAAPAAASTRELMIYDSMFSVAGTTNTTAIQLGAYADMVQIDNCRFWLGSVTSLSGKAITATGGQGLRVANSYFFGWTGATSSPAILFDPSSAWDFKAYITGNHAPATFNASTNAFVGVNADATGIAIGPNRVDGFAGGLSNATAGQIEPVSAAEMTATDITATGTVTATEYNRGAQTLDTRYWRDGFMASTALTSASTVTVNRAVSSGRVFSLVQTNAATITFGTWPTNGVSSVAIGLFPDGFATTFDTNTISGASALTITTNAWNSLLFHKGHGRTKWSVIRCDID
jgi:hypothetical protein